MRTAQTWPQAKLESAQRARLHHQRSQLRVVPRVDQRVRPEGIGFFPAVLLALAAIGFGAVVPVLVGWVR